MPASPAPQETIDPVSVVPDVRQLDGAWQADFPSGLRSMGGVTHGGAVVAAMVRAAALQTNRRPSVISAHLHSGVESGPGDISIETLTSGRTSTTARVELTQSRLRASATMLLTVDDVDDLPVTVAPAPLEPLPQPPARDFVPERAMRGASFGNSLDLVIIGENRPLGGGTEAVIQGWIRPRIHTDDSSGAATMLLDALPPTLLVLRTDPALILTIEYTVHLAPAAHRPVPPGQWYFMRQHTAWALGNLSVDDAQLWADDGQLIGTARQMRRTVPPA